MTESETRPSRVPDFWQVVKVDSLAFFVGITSFAWLLGLAFFAAFGSVGRARHVLSPETWLALIGFGLLVAVGSVVRVLDVRRVFRHGSRVRGKIVAATRDGRRPITYVYRCRGKKLHKQCLLPTESWAKRLGEGRTVSVVIDPDRPRRAWIEDLFRG